MLDIINKSKLQLPDYVESSLREICHKAYIKPSDVRLIIKRHNQHVSDCWIRKGDCSSAPSGQYAMDYHTVLVRIGRKTIKEDFRYVLAHEIGHLKQHRDQRLDLKPGWPTEDYARRFAILVCNCRPKSNYRLTGIK